MSSETPEQMTRGALQALQLERMRWTLQHAYDNVPHYRRAFEAAGVQPADLRTLADLAKFPFTAKQDLRDNYPYGLFAVPMAKVVRVHASSGTTGRPTVVGYTRGDIERWAEVMARSLRVAGATCDDIILNSYGYGLFTGGLGAHYGGEALGAAVIPMGGGNTEKQIQLIQEFRPTVIMATPSYMLTLADAMQRMGLDPSATTLRLGMFGAEPWTNQMRAEIENSLALDAIDVYGLSEIMGPGVACEFVGHKDGPHIWEDHFYPDDHRPGHRRGAARGRTRRTGVHLADQGSDADDPLSHPRPHPPAARHRMPDAADRQDHRAQRRHADHPRRERVPDPDRGSAAAPRQAVWPLSARAHPRRPPRPAHRARRVAPGTGRRHRQRPAPADRRGGPPRDQERRRHQRRDRDPGARQHRAHPGGQGQARHRPPQRRHQHRVERIPPTRTDTETPDRPKSAPTPPAARREKPR